MDDGNDHHDRDQEMVAVVFTIFEGHDLWLPDQNRSGKIRLVVLGVLENFGDENNNQKEFLIDPNDPKNEISMEWIFLKSQLSWCLDRNATFKIKISAPDEPVPEVGSLILNLRSAMNTDDDDFRSSSRILAEWKKLKVPESSSLRPELLCSWTTNRFDPTTLPRTENFERSFVALEDVNVPILDVEKGYFLLGNESDADTTFYFNIFIACVSDLKTSPDLKLFFSYYLFGNEIITDNFIPSEFRCEEATAKMRSNLPDIVTFFSQTMKESPFHIYLNSAQDGQKIGQAEADWAKLLFEDVSAATKKLENGDFAAFSGSLTIHSTSGPIGEVTVRFSLGTQKDSGLDETLSELQPAVEERQDLDSTEAGSYALPDHEANSAAKNMTFENHRLSSTSVNPEKTPVLPWESGNPPTSSTPDDRSQNPTPIMKPPSALKGADIADIPAVMPSTVKTTTMEIQPSLAETQTSIKDRMQSEAIAVEQSYVFFFKVVSIGVVIPSGPKSTTCSIKFVDSPFRLQIIKQVPFDLTTSTSLKNLEICQVPNLSYDISFKASKSKLIKVFSQKSIVLQVVVGNIIGKASIPLSHFVTKQDQAPEAQAVILSRVSSKIGVVNYRCSLIQGGSQPLPTERLIISPPKKSKPLVPDLESLEKTREELERWKHEERRKFLDQLRDVERKRLETLSDEWNRQEKERQSYHESRMKEVTEAEKSLVELLKKYRGHEKRLFEKEKEREAEWKQKMSNESSAINDLKNQLNAKETEIIKLRNENKALKKENQLLKDSNQLLVQKLMTENIPPSVIPNLDHSNSTPVAASPRERPKMKSVSVASAANTTIDEETPQNKKLREVKEKLLKTNVYHEGDDLIGLINDITRSHSTGPK